MSILRRTALISFASALVAPALGATQAPFDAPNVVEISPKLTTSGQPSAEALSELAAREFGAVIYLAPPTVPNAVSDEALIVGRQGLSYLNIPIQFGNPTAQDFQTLASVLGAFKDRKVLVHCEANFRASSLMFLYGVLVQNEDPQIAYEAVSRVWSPNGKWRQFIVGTLKARGISFEPY